MSLPNPSGEHRFPVSLLSDGRWHRVALGISSEGLELHVDCRLVGRASWSGHIGMGVSTEGLVVLGGLVEAFEIPFEVRAGQGWVWRHGLL